MPKADGTVLDNVPLPVSALNSPMFGEPGRAIPRCFAVARWLDG